MVSGGARTRSGRTPNPDQGARNHHKNDQRDWLVLPAEGRDGPLPAFPLVSPTDREMELWERLWESPQAVMWEQQAQEFEVAAYVRLLARAELPKSSSMIWAQVKQVGESLGLSVSGMQRNRWVVGTPEPEEEDTSAPVAGVASLAERLKAVQGA